jgi:tagatose 6-phosphate kinase
VQAALAGGGVEALTLSGSSPSAATHGLYADLVAMAKGRGVPVLLDSYGPALDALRDAWPDAIQVNRREAAAHLRISDPSDADLGRLLDDWSRRGARVAIVTDGPEAVLARVDGRRFRVRPPEVDVVNPIGSGDCLLAGTADGMLACLGPEALLRRAVASAVANALVWDAGAIDPEAVRRLEGDILVAPDPA